MSEKRSMRKTVVLARYKEEKEGEFKSARQVGGGKK